MTAIVPLVLFSVSGALIARAVGLPTIPTEISPAELAFRATIVDVPLVVGTLVLARWLLRARPSDLGLVRPAREHLRYGAIFGFGIFLASIAIGLVQAAAFGKEPQAIARALIGHRGPVALALDLYAVSLITPLAEELLFRGLVFGGLRQRMPFVPAAVLSAALFTALHEMQAWPGVFFLGFALALAYERTRSLWAPMVSHAVVNGLPLALLALGSGRG